MSRPAHRLACVSAIRERNTKVHFPMSVLVGLVSAGLVGCSSFAAVKSPESSVPTSLVTTGPAAQADHAEAKTQAGARMAAAHFYDLYFEKAFATSWELLSSSAKRQVRKSIWIRVHKSCLSISSGERAAAIKSVTVFGDAAIVARTIRTHSKNRTVRDVFNYDNGHWVYSPADMSIYHHGSVAADIAAARTAGLCGNGKRATL